MMSKLVSVQVSPYMLVLPAKQVRVKSGNVFADTSRAQPLQRNVYHWRMTAASLLNSNRLIATARRILF
jgi:hypothetical protein